MREGEELALLADRLVELVPGWFEGLASAAAATMRRWHVLLEFRTQNDREGRSDLLVEDIERVVVEQAREFVMAGGLQPVEQHRQDGELEADLYMVAEKVESAEGAAAELPAQRWGKWISIAASAMFARRRERVGEVSQDHRASAERLAQLEQENAQLRMKNSELATENAELKGAAMPSGWRSPEERRESAASAPQAAAPLIQKPIQFLPPPPELDAKLSRERIAELIAQGPKGHDEIHRGFDDALYSQKLGPEVLQPILQRYLDELPKANLLVAEKKDVVRWLSRTSNWLGLRFQFGEVVGTLAVYGPSTRGSLRLQTRVNGKKVPTALGVGFPSSLRAVPAPPPTPPAPRGSLRRLRNITDNK